ncbi:MAG TPA: exopolysaccharide biosynthesis protein [Acidimicrobiia bacterium]|nr:exopolysaccharide biosynthesis protein [Acidimicrobiia bacterium]
MTSPHDRGSGRTGGSSLGDELDSSLAGRDRLTVGELVAALDAHGFALVLALLLFPSALPIPTGGVTHVLELVAVLVTAQMMLGRRRLWLPRRLLAHELGPRFRTKGVPAVVRRVRWFERFARPRFARLLGTRVARTLVGALLLVFVFAAFVAPPFTGLDTLPSLGVVVICIGLLFRDGLVVAGGTAIGVAGVVLELVLGSLAWSFL